MIIIDLLISTDKQPKHLSYFCLSNILTLQLTNPDNLANHQ